MKKLHKQFWLGCAGLSDTHDVDEIHLEVSKTSRKDDFLYEFSIALVQFREGGYAMQARVFSDSWHAYRDCPEVWKLLVAMNNCFRDGDTFGRIKTPKPFDQLVKKLEEMGWKNTGRKQARFFRRCSECHQEVHLGGLK